MLKLRSLVGLCVIAIMLMGGMGTAFLLLGEAQILLAQATPPQFTSFDPQNPMALQGRQCLTINGAGFADDSKVVLRVNGPLDEIESPNGSKFTIPNRRVTFISPNRITVWAGLTEAAEWSAEVINTDGTRFRENFTVVPGPGSSGTGVPIDGQLLERIDTLVEIGAPGSSAFYNDNWEVSRDQYKAWVATIAWGEGQKGSYGAHSQGIEEGTSSDSVDVFYHRDVGCNFRFSTGIGPFQLDNGGLDNVHGTWDKWPTIQKLGGNDILGGLDSADPVETVLIQHKRQFDSGGETLADFAANSRWFSVHPDPRPDRGADILWGAVTGTNWNDHSNVRRDPPDPLALDWSNIMSNRASDAGESDPNSPFKFDENVEHLGFRQWNIGASEGIKTDSSAAFPTGRPVIFDTIHDTWLITNRNTRGEQVSKYYYTYKNGIEVWVLDNANDPINKYRYIFVREYDTDQFPEHCLGDPTSGVPQDPCRDKIKPVAGKTLQFQALIPLAPTTGPVDVFLLVDLSGSFGDDLPVFKAQAPEIIATLIAFNPDIRFGLGKYEDYPISPFGSAGAGDKAYERLVDLRPVDLTDPNDLVLNTIAGLFTRSGGDGPQSQLPALFQAATGQGQDLNGDGDYDDLAEIPPGQQANFRNGVTKLFLLWTDAPFHHPGDPGTIPYPGPSFAQTVDAILALDPPKVIGISSGGGGVTDLEAMANATNALAPAGGVDCDGNGTVDIPEGGSLVCSIASNGAGIGEAITSLIEVAVNQPPIAEASSDQALEWVSPSTSTSLNGTASSDPDGDELTFAWSANDPGVTFDDATSATPTATFLGLGTFAITLTVEDPTGATDSDTVEVTVVDTTAPYVTAALVPLGEVDDDEGKFRVEFTCSDSCDDNPSIMSATLNGIAVQNGQVVELEVEDDEEQELDEEDGVLKIEASSFELVVECMDASGNLGTATATPPFADDENHEDGNDAREDGDSDDEDVGEEGDKNS